MVIPVPWLTLWLMEQKAAAAAAAAAVGLTVPVLCFQGTGQESTLEPGWGPRATEQVRSRPHRDPDVRSGRAPGVRSPSDTPLLVRGLGPEAWVLILWCLEGIHAGFNGF